MCRMQHVGCSLVPRMPAERWNGPAVSRRAPRGEEDASDPRADLHMAPVFFPDQQGVDRLASPDVRPRDGGRRRRDALTWRHGAG